MRSPDLRNEFGKNTFYEEIVFCKPIFVFLIITQINKFMSQLLTQCPFLSEAEVNLDQVTSWLMLAAGQSFTTLRKKFVAMTSFLKKKEAKCAVVLKSMTKSYIIAAVPMRASALPSLEHLAMMLLFFPDKNFKNSDFCSHAQT